MDDNEYRIVDDEEFEMPKDVPEAYVILIKRSVLDTQRYMAALEKYKAKKRC